MSAVSAVTVPRNLPGARREAWHAGSEIAHVAGALIFVIPTLLGAYFVTGQPALQLGMYGLLLVAVLPHVGPFAGSLARHPANLLLVLLFVCLALTTSAAFVRVPSLEATFQVKALAATAVWASIYVVVFSSATTSEGVHRLVQWIGVAALAMTASVYVSALGHAVGIPFGEVVEYRDGTFRAFGPLGDNVSFLLVLPVLMSLVASRPIMFGVHLGALLLTATRGAMLCLGVGVLAYLLIVASGGHRPTWKRMVWSVAAVTVGFALWLSPMSDVLMGRLSNPSMRMTAIQMGISAFLEEPLLGTGFNGFGDSRPAVVEDWLTPQAGNALSRTMNQYVQTATEGGVVALACLLLFVLCTGRNALRVIRWRTATPQLVGVQLWLISVLVGNQAAVWFLSNTGSGFFIFAVAGLAARASALSVEQAAPRRRLA